MLRRWDGYSTEHITWYQKLLLPFGFMSPWAHAMVAPTVTCLFAFPCKMWGPWGKIRRSQGEYRTAWKCLIHRNGQVQRAVVRNVPATPKRLSDKWWLCLLLLVSAYLLKIPDPILDLWCCLKMGFREHLKDREVTSLRFHFKMK